MPSRGASIIPSTFLRSFTACLRKAGFTRVVDIETRFPADVRYANPRLLELCRCPRSDAPCSEKPAPRGPEPSESRATLPAHKNFTVVAFLYPFIVTGFGIAVCPLRYSLQRRLPCDQ